MVLKGEMESMLYVIDSTGFAPISRINKNALFGVTLPGC